MPKVRPRLPARVDVRVVRALLTRPLPRYSLAPAPARPRLPSLLTTQASQHRNYGKTSEPPRRPYEKERLDQEMKLLGACTSVPPSTPIGRTPPDF